MSNTENEVVYLRNPAEPKSVAHREYLLHLDPVTGVPIEDIDLNPDGWDVITETQYLTQVAANDAEVNALDCPDCDPDDSED